MNNQAFLRLVPVMRIYLWFYRVVHGRCPILHFAYALLQGKKTLSICVYEVGTSKLHSGVGLDKRSAIAFRNEIDEFIAQMDWTER